jgi:hypothetical protein
MGNKREKKEINYLVHMERKKGKRGEKRETSYKYPTINI